MPQGCVIHIIDCCMSDVALVEARQAQRDHRVDVLVDVALSFNVDQHHEGRMAKRTFTRADGYIPADLAHCGIDHLGAAEVLFKTGPSHYDSAGYLSHLGIELVLKGWLLEAAGAFNDGHRLSDLYQDLVNRKLAEPLDATSTALLTKLDTFFSLRYPKPEAPTEIGSEDLDTVRELGRLLYKAIPESLRHELEKIEPGKKAGRILMRKRKEE